jgi:hypothetical protein
MAREQGVWIIKSLVRSLRGGRHGWKFFSSVA